MKAIIAGAFLVTSFFQSSAFAQEAVPTFELKNLLQDCRDTGNLGRCLTRGIRSLINEYDIPDGPNLRCEARGGQYAVYDQNKGGYLDRGFSKSLTQCERSIDSIRRDMICVSNGARGFGLKNVINGASVGTSNSAIRFNQCMRSLEGIRRNRICVGGPNGQFARYNFIRGRFIDEFYNMNLRQCNRSL